jgi:hypothetical protein
VDDALARADAHLYTGKTRRRSADHAVALRAAGP